MNMLRQMRARKVHLMSTANWDSLEQRIVQSDLFAEPTQEVKATQQQLPAKKKPTTQRQDDDWI